MGSKNSVEQKLPRIEEIHRGKLDNYIEFLNSRKQQCNTKFQTNAVDKLVNIGPQSWWIEAITLIETSLKDESTGIETITTLEKIKEFLEKNQSTKYVRTFNNKCYLEYFSLLQVEPVQQKSKVKQTYVSQDRISDLLIDFFLQNNLDYSQQLFSISEEDKEKKLDNKNLLIIEQMRQNKIEQKKKNQNFIFPLIEKEIDSNDHIVSDIIKQFDLIVQDKYSEINASSVIELKQVFVQEIKFMQQFLQRLINKLYCDIIDTKSTLKQKTKENILMEIVLKALFKNTVLHDYLIDICELESQAQITSIKRNNDISQFQQLQELDIKDVFKLPKETQPYQLVIDHLILIENTKCPVGKFEQTSKLNNIICDCVDNYYNTYPHTKYSNVQKHIELETFLSILKFCIQKRNNPAFICHTKLVDLVLPNTIDFEFGESSQVWISVRAAIELLENENLYEGETKTQQLDNCIQVVIKQQLKNNQARSNSWYA